MYSTFFAGVALGAIAGVLIGWLIIQHVGSRMLDDLNDFTGDVTWISKNYPRLAEALVQIDPKAERMAINDDQFLDLLNIVRWRCRLDPVREFEPVWYSLHETDVAIAQGALDPNYQPPMATRIVENNNPGFHWPKD